MGILDWFRGYNGLPRGKSKGDIERFHKMLKTPEFSGVHPKERKLSPTIVICKDCKYRTFAFIDLSNPRGCSRCDGKLEIIAKGVEMGKNAV